MQHNFQIKNKLILIKDRQQFIKGDLRDYVLPNHPIIQDRP